MQKLLISLLTVLALLGLPTWGQAQTDIVTTTITEPVTTTASTRTLTVNSATGITAGIWLLVDNELYRVQQSYSTGTVIPVQRGPRPTTHNDNAAVWVFPIGAILNRSPQGSCVRGEGDAVYTLSVVSPTGALAGCRGAAGARTWTVTDITGANGVQSGNPPETP